MNVKEKTVWPDRLPFHCPFDVQELPLVEVWVVLAVVLVQTTVSPVPMVRVEGLKLKFLNCTVNEALFPAIGVNKIPAASRLRACLNGFIAVLGTKFGGSAGEIVP